MKNAVKMITMNILSGQKVTVLSKADFPYGCGVMHTIRDYLNGPMVLQEIRVSQHEYVDFLRPMDENQTNIFTMMLFNSIEPVLMVLDEFEACTPKVRERIDFIIDLAKKMGQPIHFVKLR